MSLQKNQMLKIEAGPLNDRFESVTFIDDGKLICAGLLPGEKAEVKIIKSGKNVSFGKVTKIIRPDRSRAGKPECRNPNCSACELIFASYERQIGLKKYNISALYGRDIEVITSPQYAYRNRAVLPVGKKDGKTVIGTYRQNSHDITAWEEYCPVMTKEMNGIIDHVKKVLGKIPDDDLPEQLYIRGFDKDYQTGFVVREPSEALTQILKNIPDVTSAFYSRSSGTNSVIIKDPVFVTGTDHCIISTKYSEYKLSPGSFFQANVYILNMILEKIGKILKPGMKVLDLYSGCGVLSDFPNVTRTCVESNKSSFGYIEENENTKLITGNAADIAIMENYDVIIADPPRKGIARELLKAIDSSTALTFIYLSCDPVTQKRDIEMMNNYEVSEITAYDMFPNTVHIESLAILKRKTV